jgi:hypothetical protein
VVFDAKYFVSNSEAEAKKALVGGVYEVACYRGLPPDATTKHGWDYDYGCLLAYDASDDGILKKAWASVTHKSEFWDGGNIYVMVI